MLRHTYSTILQVQLKEDLKTLQGLLGQASMQTSAFYIHALPQEARKAADRYDSLLTGAGLELKKADVPKVVPNPNLH